MCPPHARIGFETLAVKEIVILVAASAPLTVYEETPVMVPP
jgi:hypothetical protein